MGRPMNREYVNRRSILRRKQLVELEQIVEELSDYDSVSQIVRYALDDWLKNVGRPRLEQYRGITVVLS